jgi:hypothetical protein
MTCYDGIYYIQHFMNEFDYVSKLSPCSSMLQTLEFEPDSTSKSGEARM